MTVQDLQLIVEAAVRAALAATPSGGQPDRDRDRGPRLDERHFRRVDKFGGGTGWKEFSFQIRTAAGAAHSKVREGMDEIVKAGKDPTYDVIFDDWSDEDVLRVGSEFYAVLSSLTTGEAMTVVRGVASGNGWEAWSRLVNRFDPRTPAKALMAMMNVMQPRKVKDVRELPSAIEEWEVRVKNLKVEHDIELDENIKIALLTSFLPTDLQDFVFQWTDGKQKFGDMKDRILTLAVNRASLGRPAPMEVDKVQATHWHEDHCYEEEHDWTEEAEAEVEIDYVGESCMRCGGMGHYARECPTPKEKGKGDGARAEENQRARASPAGKEGGKGP